MAAEEKKILRIRLTPEELLVLYELATDKPDQVPREDIVPGYSAEKIEFAREFAHKSLLARELITLDESGEHQLHPFAINLVGVSLMPDSTTQLFVQDAEGETRQLEFFRYQDDIFLAHGETDSGLHDFEFLLNEDDYLQRMLDALQLDGHAKKEVPEGKLNQENFLAALEHAAEGNREELKVVLNQSAFPDQTAEALSATLADSFEVKRITATEDGTETSREMVLISGDDHLWQLDPDTKDQGQNTLRIRSTSLQEVEASIRDMHRPG
ncbi:MAG: hypothetical protein ACLFWD_05245 [Anaerolineales bacterium]